MQDTIFYLAYHDAYQPEEVMIINFIIGLNFKWQDTLMSFSYTCRIHKKFISIQCHKPTFQILKYNNSFH